MNTSRISASVSTFRVRASSRADQDSSSALAAMRTSCQSLSVEDCDSRLMQVMKSDRQMTDNRWRLGVEPG